MNILLWVFQVALALLCISGGTFKIFKMDDLKKDVNSMRTLSKSLWIFIGAFEVLAGLGLLWPMACPVAAGAIFIESVLISSIYIYYRDFAPMKFTLVMALMAAFITYGRFALVVL